MNFFEWGTGIANPESCVDMIYVYAISSIDKNYIYVGMTNNLPRRLREHNNNGYSRSTKPYAPFKLIYKKPFPDRRSARIPGV